MEKVKNTYVSAASALYNLSCLNHAGVKSESLQQCRGSAVSLLLGAFCPVCNTHEPPDEQCKISLICSISLMELCGKDQQELLGCTWLNSFMARCSSGRITPSSPLLSASACEAGLLHELCKPAEQSCVWRRRRCWLCWKVLPGALALSCPESDAPTCALCVLGHSGVLQL